MGSVAIVSCRGWGQTREILRKEGPAHAGSSWNTGTGAPGRAPGWNG